jgi:RimJ/RimL family protein N-acetyltransferase
MATPLLAATRLPQTLTDGVVTLDGHRLGDAEVHWRSEDEEMRRRFDARRRATLKETRAAIQRWIDQRAAGGPAIAYAVRQVDGPLVGGCEIRLLAKDRADVSYWTYAAFRRRGFGARALALLCEAAAQAIDTLESIEAHVDPDNEASRKLAESAGFEAAGCVKDEAWDGVATDRIRYVRRLSATS